MASLRSRGRNQSFVATGMSALGWAACAVLLVLSGCDRRGSAATAPDAPRPPVVLDAGRPEDADAAIDVVRRFLNAWERGRHQEALQFVAERHRQSFAKELARNPVKVQRIDRIRLFEYGGKMLARVHASTDPSPSRPDLPSHGIGIDMAIIDGKWWVIVR